RSRKGCWIAAGLLVVFCLSSALFGRFILDRRPTLAMLERRVRAEFPLGSTRSSVEAWLNGNTVSFVIVEGAIKDSIHGERGVRTIVQEAGLTDRQIGASIRATVENVTVISVWQSEVDVYFFFDHQDLLIGYHFMTWQDAL